jgi:hypothetical protein
MFRGGPAQHRQDTLLREEQRRPRGERTDERGGDGKAAPREPARHRAHDADDEPGLDDLAKDDHQRAERRLASPIGDRRRSADGLSRARLGRRSRRNPACVFRLCEHHLPVDRS